LIDNKDAEQGPGF